MDPEGRAWPSRARPMCTAAASAHARDAVLGVRGVEGEGSWSSLDFSVLGVSKGCSLGGRARELRGCGGWTGPDRGRIAHSLGGGGTKVVHDELAIR